MADLLCLKNINISFPGVRALRNVSFSLRKGGVHALIGENGAVLGIDCGPAESEEFWAAFLRSLKKRELDGVRLVTPDAHQGLKNAAAKVLGATWQRCRVHFMRNAPASVPTAQHQMVAAVIRAAFVQERREEAVSQWRETADRMRPRVLTPANLMDAAESDVLAFMGFPTEHWRQIACTNPLERVNKEIKRRADVIGIFPNDAAIVRLVGTLVTEQTEEWHLTRRYMSRESIAGTLHPTLDQTLLGAQEVA